MKQLTIFFQWTKYRNYFFALSLLVCAKMLICWFSSRFLESCNSYRLTFKDNFFFIKETFSFTIFFYRTGEKIMSIFSMAIHLSFFFATHKHCSLWHPARHLWRHSMLRCCKGNFLALHSSALPSNFLPRIHSSPDKEIIHYNFTTLALPMQTYTFIRKPVQMTQNRIQSGTTNWKNT